MFCLFYIIPIISSLYSKNSNTSAKLLIKFGLCKKLAESLLRKDKLSKFVRILDVLFWTIKDNYRLGDDIQSKVLAFAFGLSAEIERNLISQRTKEALARKKSEGGSAVRTPKRKDFSTRNLQTSPQRKTDTRPARRGCFICQDRQYTESEQGHRAALLPYFFRREKMPTLLRISK